MIAVQTEDFNVAELYGKLADNPGCGAVVNFVGKVRDFGDGKGVTTMTLEHYPGMTEAVLTQLEAEARERWPLDEVIVIHRVGPLKLNDQIVFVGVSSAHRKAAFAAAEFLIDVLKSRAPFWKKETSTDGDNWVEAKDADQQAAEQWKR